MKLLIDIYSSVKSKILYGKKNDEVKIIATHGDVMIVEGPDGNKFPVDKKNLRVS